MRIVNVPDLSPSDDDFTRLPLQNEADWIGLSGLPSNGVERRITALRLPRYRAAVQAAMAARSADAVISHLPLMTAATAEALRIINRRVPHLAFSFNFTDLPTGRRLRYMRHAFVRVDQFAIFSRYERGVYSNLFELPEDRFSPLMWTQTPPPADADPGVDISRPFYCAIGGEGRDMALIFACARKMQGSRFVVIARPRTVDGFAVPDNVELMTNVPLARTWAIASASMGVLVPLLSETTCCGHITLVSAKQLGIPVVTTEAFATREYVEGRDAILECAPGEVGGFTDLLQQLADEQPRLQEAAQAARPAELALHDRSKWARYVDAFLSRCT